MAPGVGDMAPDFELDGTGGHRYALADERGATVVLVFYPADNTPVCSTQLSAYNSDLASFTRLGAQVLAISPQDVASHEAFADELGLTFPLLADLDKTVGRSYGVMGPLGFYRRSVFVIDAAGAVRYAHRSVGGFGFRPVDEVVLAVEAAA